MRARLSVIIEPQLTLPLLLLALPLTDRVVPG